MTKKVGELMDKPEPYNLFSTGRGGQVRISLTGRDNCAFDQTIRINRKAVIENSNPYKRAFLEIHCNGHSPVLIELDESEFTIGRGIQSRIQIQSPSVSRVHARISLKNEEYLIEDLNSTNGTYVNGVRVKRCTLRSSDQVQIGEVRAYFLEELRWSSKR